MDTTTTACRRCRKLTRRLALQGLLGGLGMLALETLLPAAPRRKTKPAEPPCQPDTSVLAEEIAGAYARRAWETINNWQTLGTAEKRGEDLGKAVQLALGMAGVPPADRIVVETLEIPRWAQFNSKTWRLSIDPSPLQVEAISRDAAIELIALIYHECRHAQQFWRIARRLAARLRARTGRQIQGHFGIWDEIASLAIQCPIGRDDPSAKEAEFWFEHQDDSQKALEEAQKEMTSLGMRSPSDNPTAYENIRKKYLSYPLEADAHEGYHLVKRLFATEQRP